MRSVSILIVEDETGTARDLQASLEELGYVVRGPITTAVEALEAVAATAPDLVLLDIKLKGEPDGLALAKQLRQAGGPPVIFLSAHLDAALVDQARIAEPYGYILKPFDIHTLAFGLQAALQRSVRDRAYVREQAHLAAELDTAHAAITGMAEALRLAEQTRETFLTALSHELHTPLTAILGFAELLDSGRLGPLTDRQHRAVRRIRQSGDRLMALVTTLLDYVALQGGGSALRNERVSIDQVCRMILERAQMAAEARSLTLHYLPPPQAATVTADSARLTQLLSLLVENAIKFTPEGGTVGIDAQGCAEDGSHQIAVWDTGAGISPEQREALFRPFVQLDARLARDYEGMGIGLALVNRLVDLHGGTLRMESAPGQGNRFIITLPGSG